MPAEITSRSDSSITIELIIPLDGSMLSVEEQIQQELNEAGRLATGEKMSQFDTDGSPIQVGSIRLTSKGAQTEYYQTPYGTVHVERHVYQSSKGGKTFCPMERDARMVLNATPRLAKMVSFKYSDAGAIRVTRDFEECHGRKISRGYVKDLSDMVGTIALAKEDSWCYALPKMDRPVEFIALGLDGTCMLLYEDGWREAMTGTIAFYDGKGERMHTIYTGATPQYGKSVFRDRFSREIDRVKEAYPKATYVGLADGTENNWDFLRSYVDYEVLDFFHASEYVGGAADAIFRTEADREEWLTDRLHKLKHKQGAAMRLLSEMQNCQSEVRGKVRMEKLDKAITYFTNQHPRMKYSKHVAQGMPIGSGVTEAACKVLVKQRLCNSGMRWKDDGASVVLSVRALVMTQGRWDEFWNRIDRYGVPAYN